MAAPLHIPSRWSLVAAGAPTRPGTLHGNHLIWPQRSCAGLSPLLCGLAPNRDHNADLSQALATLPDHAGENQPVFSVFAADPFINGKRIATTLLDKGYARIVNWPTTAQYGSAFVRTLDSVHLGPQQECETLRRFATQGLRISAAVSLPEYVEAFLELQPQVLFIAPGFDLWRKSGRFDAAKLLRHCAAIAHVADDTVPIVLMADRGNVSLEQARSAGAHALLVA